MQTTIEQQSNVLLNGVLAHLSVFMRSGCRRSESQARIMLDHLEQLADSESEVAASCETLELLLNTACNSYKTR